MQRHACAHRHCEQQHSGRPAADCGVLPVGIQRVWSHPTLMGVARQLLDPDGETGIAGHPVWNLRCKTPEQLSHGQATVPWHQDNAYLDEESWATLQVTAWVPLVDTNATNGCMQVVRAL